jgi:hypothetical protein
MSTDLPATFVEAEALLYARSLLARMRTGNFFDLGGAPLDEVTGHTLARRWCRWCIELNPQSASQVVELAVRHGEQSAHEALVEVIDDKTDRNEPLGAVLGAYSIDLRRRPFRKHTGPKRTTIIEDVVYSLLIIEIVERFNLKPSRYTGRKHSRPSACSIVAQAAAAEGLHRGEEDAFRKIWDRTKPKILPEVHRSWPTAEAWAILKRSRRTVS